MGLEEGGGSVAAVKNSPVDCFLAGGESRAVRRISAVRLRAPFMNAIT